MAIEQVGARRVKERRDWYSVSVESIRTWTTLAVLIAAGVVGFLVYQTVAESLQERDAATVIEDSRQLLEELSKRPDVVALQQELTPARAGLREAQEHFRDGRFAEALSSARQSRTLLLALEARLEERSGARPHQFILVEGTVEVRRGTAGSWLPARSRQTLSYGDYVRTGNGGSAQILFPDGTFSTVRPNSMILVSRRRSSRDGRQEEQIDMQYGWIDLSTHPSSEGRVSTPTAETRVEQDSDATVTYEQESRTSRFIAHRGRMELLEDGQRREIRPLEQAVKSGDQPARIETVPARVLLTGPPDNSQINLDGKRRVELVWEEVDEAARYALQISRSPMFVNNIIDVVDRSKTTAALGLRGEGSFQWRVAAINSAGERGPWSAPRKFRVASFQGDREEDQEPPELKLASAQPHGNFFIFSGTTEPGATVQINGEGVPVSADGRFTKTIQFDRTGLNTVVIQAQDAWGNIRTREQQVFVESL